MPKPSLPPFNCETEAVLPESLRQCRASPSSHEFPPTHSAPEEKSNSCISLTVRISHLQSLLLAFPINLHILSIAIAIFKLLLSSPHRNRRRGAHTLSLPSPPGLRRPSRFTKPLPRSQSQPETPHSLTRIFLIFTGFDSALRAETSRDALQDPRVLFSTCRTELAESRKQRVSNFGVYDGRPKPSQGLGTCPGTTPSIHPERAETVNFGKDQAAVSQ